MRIVVVGGGLAGMASAARLAKLGHQVTLFEASEHLGGALGRIERDGFVWDAGATSTLLPAVLRDLFRKSGKPLESEVELTPCAVIREHVFADGSRVQVTGGSRAAQLRDFEALGPGLGQRWVDHVASFNSTWDLLRRHYFERPWDPALADPAAAKVLSSRDNLQQRLRGLNDRRLMQVAAHPLMLDGHNLRKVPAWMGLSVYLEQKFGAWTVEGGLSAVAEALTRRLATRRVTVELAQPVSDCEVQAGRVVGVRVAGGVVPADAVVCAVDPATLPTLARVGRRPPPVAPGRVVHLGLTGDLITHPLVFHLGSRPDAAIIQVAPGGAAPDGHQAVQVRARGVDGDLLSHLAAAGLPLHDRCAVAWELTPDERARWSGALGPQWRGRATTRSRLGPRTPIDGLYAAGAMAAPGAGVPWVGLSAALVAQVIGPALRDPATPR